MLPPVFDMNLPEGSLRRLLTTRYGKLVTGFNDLALLALVGRNTIGRLSFGSPAQHSAALDIASVVASASSEDLLHRLYTGDAVFSGIAGTQPKVIAALDDAAIVKFSDPVVHEDDMRLTFLSNSVIVKSSSAEFPWLAANEYHCLRAAKFAGLDVPDMRLLQEGQVLLVSRFDKRLDDSGQTNAIGAEDFCALAGLLSAAKHEASYERALKILKQHIPGSASSAVSSFFKLLVLNCVLHNGDAHLKNFSVRYECARTQTEPDVELAPVYDIVTTNAYITRDRLALTLAGSKRYPSRETLVKFGRLQALLLPAAIERIFDDVVRAVRAASVELQEYGRHYPVFHQQVGQSMLDCWQAGLRRIGSALDLADAGESTDLKNST